MQAQAVKGHDDNLVRTTRETLRRELAFDILDSDTLQAF